MSAGFEEVYHFQKLYYVHGSILKKSPEDEIRSLLRNFKFLN